MGKSSPTKIQVKHIPDKAIIDLVDRLWNAPRADVGGGRISFFYPNGASLFDICKQWDSIPPKVILAKLKKLVDRNYIDGCACGCRGDFTVIHEHDLPFVRLFDVVREEWVEHRIPRSMYRLWQNGSLKIAGH